MSFFAKPLLAALVLATPLVAGVGGIAVAQMRPAPGIVSGNFDPAQLPEFKGKVTQYTLTPRGDVDGLILDDGTEIQVPPHLSSALVFSVKPGDAVSIRGLKSRNVAMVSAVTVTNIASGAVVGNGVTGGRPEDLAKLEASGKIKAILHTPRGDVGGALLEDGTVIRMPPPEATKQAALLVVGQSIAVKGIGISSPLGKSIGALEIGPSPDKMVKIEMPRHHGPRGMMRGPDGMGGKGPMHP